MRVFVGGLCREKKEIARATKREVCQSQFRLTIACRQRLSDQSDLLNSDTHNADLLNALESQRDSDCAIAWDRRTVESQSGERIVHSLT